MDSRPAAAIQTPAATAPLAGGAGHLPDHFRVLIQDALRLPTGIISIRRSSSLPQLARSKGESSVTWVMAAIMVAFFHSRNPSYGFFFPESR